MKADLVCEGGGVKGIALVGAICCLENHGYQWQRLAGTSAGAIVAALIAAGYTGEELSKIMLEINYNDFNDKTLLQSVPFIGQPLSLLWTKGMYSGKAIEEFVAEKLKAKKRTKFKHISENGNSKLKIMASDITRRKLMILPDSLAEYGINPMEFEIAKAVKMSVSIPLYYNPVILKYEGGSSYVVDGGLLSNFPIWIFDVASKPRWPTFGLNLDEPKENKQAVANLSLLGYVSDIVGTILSRDEEVYLRNKDIVRTIHIPTLNIKTTQFDISKEESMKLFQSGYQSACDFINQWSFEDYVMKHRTCCE